MSVVLVGPFPPPHGGISVHVEGIFRRLTAAGTPCVALDPAAFSSKRNFARSLRRSASEGSIVHVHANGHNLKSWLLALLCGTVNGESNPARILTIHSGMAPEYLRARRWRRELARQACRQYQRIICVSEPIQQTVVESGIPFHRTEVAPAYLPPQLSATPIEPALAGWMSRRHPLISATLSFRPEYGVELLISALATLRNSYPEIGCILMGAGEGREKVEHQIRELHLQANVLVPGDVEHSRCLQLISRSDLFVRPTLADGDSNSVREAISLGVPVVASRVGTRPHGVFLFSPGDTHGLIEQAERALTTKRSSVDASTGAIDRLMQLYGVPDHAETICA